MVGCADSLGALPEAEIKRLEELVIRKPQPRSNIPDGLNVTEIDDANTHLRISQRKACDDAIAGGAYSVLAAAFRNPDQSIWGSAVMNLSKVPPVPRRELLLLALMIPEWPSNRLPEEGGGNFILYNIQAVLCGVLSEALGEEIKLTGIWSAEDRKKLAERLRNGYSVPPQPGNSGGFLGSLVSVPNRNPIGRPVGTPANSTLASKPSKAAPDMENDRFALYLCATVAFILAGAGAGLLLRLRKKN